MSNKVKKVLMTGAAGYVANQLLPTFLDRYEMVLLDSQTTNQNGIATDRIHSVDLIDPDRTNYAHHFQGVDAVVHLARKKSSGPPLEHFFDEKANVEMTYNVLRSAYEAGVPRLAIASSNHASDWYEHALIHERKMEIMDPYDLPLSDNFYGWAKASYEHLGFLFACGAMDFRDASGREFHTGGLLHNVKQKPEVVMIRIGAARELDITIYEEDPAAYKRDLGAYVSARDLTQLFVKAIETPNIENRYGVSWHVVYGISNNTRAFWSLVNAREVLGYCPLDDSEVKFAADIRRLLIRDAANIRGGRVGPP